MKERQTQPSEPDTVPATRALWELLDLARNLPVRQDEAWLIALAWLAAVKLAIGARTAHVSKPDRLLDKAGWLKEERLPTEVTELVWRYCDQGTAAKALGVVMSLVEGHGTSGWEVADAMWGRRGATGEPAWYSPQLCNLLVAALDAPRGARVWIPFDSSGQLFARAIRKGWQVIASGPDARSDVHLRLLEVIESDAKVSAQAIYDVGHDKSGARNLQAEYLLCAPPLGMPIHASSEWRQWMEVDSHANPNWERVLWVPPGRAENWSISGFWPRISRRAVFLVSQSVLFAKGQEERLREYLIQTADIIKAVVTLPLRQLESTNVAPALLVLEKGKRKDAIRMVDAAAMTSDAKSSMRNFKELDDTGVLKLISTKLTKESRQAIDVTRQEIDRSGVNLIPARYLQRNVRRSWPVIRLGDTVTLIRAPVPVKDPTATVVHEVGIPDLKQWRPIVNPTGKEASVRLSKLGDSGLREGDLVLSIKGTVGKSGIMGEAPSGAGVIVPSQSCVALRPRSDTGISAIFLLLYLRSKEFQHQIESLRVGAVIAHVTPGTLLEAIQVPILTVAQQRECEDKYRELCALEAEIEQKRGDLDELHASIFVGVIERDTGAS